MITLYVCIFDIRNLRSQVVGVIIYSALSLAGNKSHDESVHFIFVRRVRV